jgi:hypothetical protein
MRLSYNKGMDLKKFSFLAYFDLSQATAIEADKCSLLKEPKYIQSVMSDNLYIEYISKFTKNSDNPFDFQLRLFTDKKFKTLFLNNISNLQHSCFTLWALIRGVSF